MNQSSTPLPRMRRTLNRREGGIDTQIDAGDRWRMADKKTGATGTFAISPAFTTAFELARYERLGLADGATVLPICPASFREFMVFEKHAIAGARGLVRAS